MTQEKVILLTDFYRPTDEVYQRGEAAVFSEFAARVKGLNEASTRSGEGATREVLSGVTALEQLLGKARGEEGIPSRLAYTGYIADENRIQSETGRRAALEDAAVQLDQLRESLDTDGLVNGIENPYAAGYRSQLLEAQHRLQDMASYLRNEAEGKDRAVDDRGTVYRVGLVAAGVALASAVLLVPGMTMAADGPAITSNPNTSANPEDQYQRLLDQYYLTGRVGRAVDFHASCAVDEVKMFGENFVLGPVYWAALKAEAPFRLIGRIGKKLGLGKMMVPIRATDKFVGDRISYAIDSGKMFCEENVLPVAWWVAHKADAPFRWIKNRRIRKILRRN